MPEITVKTEFKSCPFCSSEDIKVEQIEQDNDDIVLPLIDPIIAQTEEE